MRKVMFLTIEEAVAALNAGELVVVPTETVYGLAASIADEKAILRIFEAKGRPSNNPLIVHVADATQAQSLASSWPRSAAALAAAFWPGPLTIVVPKDPSVSDLVTAGRPTVALRVPSHPLMLQLLEKSGLALAAPSANPFMGISPTRTEMLEPQIVAQAAGVVDGGACEIGIESTVVDCTGPMPVILREGKITLMDMRRIVPETVRAESDRISTSPGQHKRHYAPQTPLLLVDDLGDERGVTFGPARAQGQVAMPEEPTAYMQQLYAVLHAQDQLGQSEIYWECPPSSAEWSAVLDRLRRASTTESD